MNFHRSNLLSKEKYSFLAVFYKITWSCTDYTYIFLSVEYQLSCQSAWELGHSPHILVNISPYIPTYLSPLLKNCYNISTQNSFLFLVCQNLKFSNQIRDYLHLRLVNASWLALHSWIASLASNLNKRCKYTMLLCLLPLVGLLLPMYFCRR